MSRGRARIAMELAGGDPHASLQWIGQRPVRVVVDRGLIRWDYIYKDGAFGPGEPEAGFGFPDLPVAPPVVEGRLALLDFLALVDASPETIRRFVAKWGPLNLCRHGLPATHWPVPSEQTPREGPWCTDREGDALHGQESIELIRGWASVARAALRIGLDLARDSEATGNQEDWRGVGVESTPITSKDANRQLSSVLNLWLALGLIWVQVDLVESPHLRLTAIGAFGVVARQLAEAAINASVALCVACGEPYETPKRPRAHEDTYCTKRKCKAASRNAASRRSRRRNRPVP
jgi:hypothetical protein